MKAHFTITIDQNIITAHKAAGSNISKLCNDYLGGYFLTEGETLLNKTETETKAIIEKAKNKATLINNAVQTAQKQAVNTKITNSLLKQAFKLNIQNKDFKPLIDGAQQISGLNRAELVQQMERI